MVKQQWAVGIDEVGRGPLAGPVAVGVAVVPTTFDWSQLPGVGDSKKLSIKQRTQVTDTAVSLRRRQELRYEIAMVSATVIDQIGIVAAIDLAMSRGLVRVLRATVIHSVISPAECLVKLDGSLRAPSIFLEQETIVRGDAKVPVIGLASIVAKTYRDNYMTQLAKKPGFTGYGFQQHKGYGTVEHRRAIAQYGLSQQHRRSFCRKYWYD